MIYIDNRQNKIEVTDTLEDTAKKIIDYALKAEELDVKYEISLTFVDNESIREINRENRDIDKDTDVLSFPMLDYPKGKVYKEVYKDYEFMPQDLDGENLVLGDIVLSLEKAEEQSKEYGHSFLRESCYLIIHSILHLLGYDHMEEDEKNIMKIGRAHV